MKNKAGRFSLVSHDLITSLTSAEFSQVYVGKVFRDLAHCFVVSISLGRGFTNRRRRNLGIAKIGLNKHNKKRDGGCFRILCARWALIVIWLFFCIFDGLHMCVANLFLFFCHKFLYWLYLEKREGEGWRGKGCF